MEIETIINNPDFEYSFTLCDLQNKSMAKIMSSMKDYQDKFGVYLFFINEKTIDNLVYIGMAGTFDNNSQIFKGQTLYERLKNTRDNLYVKNYFIPKFEGDTKIKEIIILGRFKKGNDELPAYMEAKLLSKYFGKYRKLPKWNKYF